MPASAVRACRHTLAVSSFIFMVACGGGGGVSGNNTGGGGDGASGGVAVSTGLVPVAPTVGVLLYDRAENLRPLSPGSKWVYRRADYRIGNFSEAVVRQTAGTGNAVVEVDFGFQGDTTTLTTSANGTVTFNASLDLGSGLRPLEITGVELASPVRVGNQDVLVDRRITDAGVDVDGDGKNDGLDVAAWRVVIGNEPVQLPNRNAPMTALRVDSFLSLRLLASTGAARQAVTSQVSTWYAPGIGVMRQTVASTDPSRTVDEEDLLLGYDGGTRGYGYVVQDPVSVAGLPSLGSPGQVVQVADGVAVNTERGVVLSLDKSGRLVSTRDFAPSGVVPITKLLRLDGGLRMSTFGSFPTLDLYRLGTDGSLLSSIPVRLDLSGGRANTLSEELTDLAASIGSSRAWLLWSRSWQSQFGQTAQEVVLRAFDANGVLATPEIRFPSTSQLIDSSSLRLAVRGDAAVVTWHEFDTSGNTTDRVVSVDAGGNVTLNATINNPSAAGFTAPIFRPLADTNNLWLQWSGASASSSQATAHALRLDAAGLPVDANSDPAGLLAAMVSPWDDELTAGWPSRFVANEGTWYGIGEGSGHLFADDQVTRRWLTVAALNPGARSPTGAVQTLLKYRIPVDPTLNSLPIVFPDRVLLLTSVGGELRPTVIWR